ncbi:MAG TPA: GntR family transcriptional regulator [Jatrophihabitans sp.]|nr:GntR family transcriptional regulator [Jatrophihabitans sp.]
MTATQSPLPAAAAGTSAATARARVKEPKYYAVKRHLLEIIGTLPPGSLIPTERELTARVGTSRTTVRQALSDLVAEGRLIRRQGAGTFVAEPKITWPLQLTSFTEQAAAVGFQAGARLLSAVRLRAEAEAASRLALAAGTAVYRLERLRLADGSPVALEISYLSAARFPGLLGRVRRAPSLYRVLTERYRIEPVDAEETIETAPATPRQAELLHTDTGAPMLVLSRHSFDRDGTPLEWVRSWYRGDRYTFVARLLQHDGHRDDR